MKLTEAQKVEIRRHIHAYEKYVSDTLPNGALQSDPDRWEYIPSIVTEALFKKVPFFSLTLKAELSDNKIIYSKK